MAREFWLMDERALDPEQFGDAQVYACALTLDEAKIDRTESGCGVIIEVEIAGGEAEWKAHHE